MPYEQELIRQNRLGVLGIARSKSPPTANSLANDSLFEGLESLAIPTSRSERLWRRHNCSFFKEQKMAIRVQQKSEDFGRCGCGRRDYCDGSHGLSEAQWQELQAKEQEALRKETCCAEASEPTKMQ